MPNGNNRRREYDDDDGHVIAPMNVEGMPWYRKDPVGDKTASRKEPEYSKKETWYIIAGTLKAALLIAGAFFVVFFLFILMLCLAAKNIPACSWNRRDFSFCFRFAQEAQDKQKREDRTHQNTQLQVIVCGAGDHTHQGGTGRAAHIAG